METHQKAIVYDDNCPLCCWYTAQFVKADLLKAEHRISFVELAKTKQLGLAKQLDAERSRHEIPLLDLEGKETIYGLDSLVFILGQKVPFLPKLMKVKPIYLFFKILYSLVSYNRRVIVAVLPNAKGLDCTPDFHVGYRLAYILMAFICGSMLFYSFMKSMTFAQIGLGIMGFGIIAALFGILFFKDWKAKIAYFGQMATIYLIGGLVLLSSVLLEYMDVNIYPFLGYLNLLFVCGLMLKESIRRMAYLKNIEYHTTIYS